MAGIDRVHRVLYVLAAVLAIAAVAPALGAAKPPASLPDDSSIDEYIPSIPDVGGDRQLEGGGDESNGGAAPGGGTTRLPAPVVEQLRTLDPAGDAVVDFAEQTGPPRHHGDASESGTGDRGGGDASGGGGGDGGDASNGGGAALPALAGVSDQSAVGIGAGLPIILGVVLLGALALAVSRRRHDADER
jgi:hypothetical protein